MAAAKRTRSHRRPADPPHGTDPFGSWQALAALATAILGLGAYVYVLGGIVVWLDAVAARLSADDVTTVVESRVLLTVGVRTLFVEMALATVVALAIPAIRLAAQWFELHASGQVDREGAISDLSLTVFLRAVTAGLALAALLGRHADGDSGLLLGIATATMILWSLVELGIRSYTTWLRPPRRSERASPRHRLSVAVQFAAIVGVLVLALWQTAAPLGMAMFVTLVLLGLADRFPPFSGRRRSRRRRRALAVVVAAVAVNLVIVTYVGTPPVTYSRAEVTVPGGGVRTGAYLGRDADGVYLGVCTPVIDHPDRSKEERIEVIPSAKVEALELGGPAYSFDVGHRPSLLALAWHLASGAKLGGDSDKPELDVREPRPVCGEPST